MRNMSFMLTTEQVLARAKTVRKGMGLRKGEKVERLGGPVRVLRVDRQRLDWIRGLDVCGFRETTAEGFTGMSPEEFVEFFCQTHRGCRPDTVVTRIEFEYVEAAAQQSTGQARGMGKG